MNYKDKVMEEFYAYAERNIRGYKRPKDYAERWEKKEEKKRKPMRESIRGYGAEQ